MVKIILFGIHSRLFRHCQIFNFQLDRKVDIHSHFRTYLTHKQDVI